MREAITDLLRKQIYQNNKKSYHGKKQTMLFKNIQQLHDNLPDQSLRTKSILLMYRIQELLITIRNTSEFWEAQLIELHYNDPILHTLIGKKKPIFYALRNHYEEFGLLHKVKMNTYYVNPFYLNNMTDKQWEAMVEGIHAADQSEILDKFSADMNAYIMRTNPSLLRIVQPQSVPAPPAYDSILE